MKVCLLTRIMTTNTLSCISEMFVYIYTFSYIMRNKYCHYTSSHINKKYTFMYDINIYCYYILFYIIINTLSCMI